MRRPNSDPQRPVRCDLARHATARQGPSRRRDRIPRAGAIRPISSAGPAGPCRQASSKQAMNPPLTSGRWRRIRSGSGANAAIRSPARAPPRRMATRLSRKSTRSTAGAERPRRNIILNGPLIELRKPGASGGATPPSTPMTSTRLGMSAPQAAAYGAPPEEPSTANVSRLRAALKSSTSFAQSTMRRPG
jgi:hypothetical protein